MALVFGQKRRLQNKTTRYIYILALPHGTRILSDTGNFTALPVTFRLKTLQLVDFTSAAGFYIYLVCLSTERFSASQKRPDKIDVCNRKTLPGTRGSTMCPVLKLLPPTATCKLDPVPFSSSPRADPLKPQCDVRTCLLLSVLSCFTATLKQIVKKNSGQIIIDFHFMI